MDPYTPPNQIEDTPTMGAHDSIVELVKGWERLRFRYNLICFCFGVSVLYILNDGRAGLDFGVAFGILANIGFFFGPLAELYLRGLFGGGKPNEGMRKSIYWVGTVFTVMVILLNLL